MKLLLLNGPPRSGKDTCASFLPTWRHEKFSAPLKAVFASTLSLSETQLAEIEFTKEAPVPLLGCSFRQFQIKFSEDFMKPTFGTAIFARLLLERLHATYTPLVVISDCGFQIEINELLNSFKLEDTLLVRLHRPGCTFAGDSRSYTALPGRDLDLQNDGTLEDLHAKLSDAIKDFIA